MRRSISSAILTVLLFTAAAAAAETGQPEIERQIRQTAEALTESYFGVRAVNFRENLAVVEFRDISETGKHGNIARGVEDLFTATFSRSTRFRLVERRNIEALMEEQKLQLMGLTESDSAVELGRIHNAQALLLGTVNAVGERFFVSVRLVNVETGREPATAGPSSSTARATGCWPTSTWSGRRAAASASSPPPGWST